MKKIKLMVSFVIIIILLCSCGINRFVFQNYQSGDIISNSIDGNIYKLNSKFVMFDDAGALDDSIVRINFQNIKKYETAGDYYNEGTDYYKAIINEVYCSESYIVVTLKNSEKCVLIDCSKDTKSDSITEVKSRKSIPINYSKFTKIQCE